ncbi:MAG: hypothetical protein U1F67_24505 [Rubrivivax sp.]
MTGWLPASAAVLLASLVGLGLARLMPWSPRARAAWVPETAGLAMAPLLLGLSAVLVLWFVPGLAAGARWGVVMGRLLAGALALWAAGRRRTPPPRHEAAAGPYARGDPVARWAAGIFALCVLVLFALAALIPLTQNDALEYAIVGREIHAAGDLRLYPVLDPGRTQSGFFGPWTHPPLYVSLIALAFALQGHDGDAALVRLIAPWFLVTSALLVAALAGLGGRARQAWFAAVLFLAAPLLYLGAASSLIDALPVLGLTLALALVVGLEAPPWRRGACIGIALGAALWTHSVSVIFPALLVPALWAVARLRQLRAGAALAVACREAVAMLAVAAAIAAWPYIRNVELFGNPVSDNPVVFALASLDWKSYFTVMRSLGTPAERVQYGLLKGWFAIESYSLVFWLAVAGLPLAWRAWGRAARPAAPTQPSAPAGPPGGTAGDAPALAVAGLVLVVYHLLVVVSLLLGVDVMVRNERYMLVIMPCAALLAAAALAGEPGRGGRRRAAVLGVLAALTLAQLAAMMVYRAWPVWRSAVLADGAALDWWAPMAVQRRLAALPAATTKVLTLKPADMFHSRQRMLSYLDPQMVAFYGLGDAASAARWLRERGVTHVHVPDYWLPPLYNSRLAEVLAAPSLSELVADEGGFQVYRLRDPMPAASATCAARLFAGWQRTEELRLRRPQDRAARRPRAGLRARRGIGGLEPHAAASCVRARRCCAAMR